MMKTLSEERKGDPGLRIALNSGMKMRWEGAGEGPFDR